MTDFHDFKLNDAITRALTEEKYLTPTPIQAQTIPTVMAGRDVIGIAQTGTGKTAAFALPILHHLAANPRALERKTCRVLVLSPTRELSGQILDSFRAYGRHLRIRSALAIGGVLDGRPGPRPLQRRRYSRRHARPAARSRQEQRASAWTASNASCSTKPTACSTWASSTTSAKSWRSFRPNRQTLMFSATMPGAIAELAAHMLRDPVKVAVAPAASTVERVEQRVIRVDRAAKPAVLVDVLRSEAVDRALIFTRTKHGADKVVRRLVQAGIAAEAIHGNKSQGQRERVLAAFRNGKVKTLVATDIAARGIDVDGISHVVNFDLPQRAGDLRASHRPHRARRRRRASPSRCATPRKCHSCAISRNSSACRCR